MVPFIDKTENVLDCKTQKCQLYADKACTCDHEKLYCILVKVSNQKLLLEEILNLLCNHLHLCSYGLCMESNEKKVECIQTLNHMYARFEPKHLDELKIIKLKVGLCTEQKKVQHNLSLQHKSKPEQSICIETLKSFKEKLLCAFEKNKSLPSNQEQTDVDNPANDSIKDALTKLGLVYQHFALTFFALLSLILSIPRTTTVINQRQESNLQFQSSVVSTVDRVFEENTELKTSSPINSPALQLRQVLSDPPPTRNSQTSRVSGNVKRESYRLSTFTNFPNTSVNCSLFSRAGFYYTGRGDEVECFVCGRKLHNLLSSTDPFLLQNHEPNCTFVRGVDECGNVSLDGISHFSLTAPSLHANSSAGDVLMGAVSARSNNFSVASGYNPGSSAHSMSQNRAAPRQVTYQSAQVVSPATSFQSSHSSQPPIPPPVYDVPFGRQLAQIIDPQFESFLRSLDLRRESERLRTFKNWPSTQAPEPKGMARSGWFYLGNLDRSQCFSCGGVLRNWRRMDNPGTEHSTHFPHCVMAQGREQSNVPDLDHTLATSMSTSPGASSTHTLSNQQREDLKAMFPCLYPVIPHMAAFQQRVATFGEWLYTIAKPTLIAEAGFFYLGQRDRVKCFYCNGGLQNWRRADDPWIEHAKWYPTCEFLIQHKGLEFIQEIVERFPSLNRPVMHGQGRDVPPPQSRLPSVQSGPDRLPCPPSKQTNPQLRAQNQAKQLEKAMSSEAAKTVIDMGFAIDSVRQATKNNIDLFGAPFSGAEALLDAVVDLQESQNSQTSMNQSSFHASLPNFEESANEAMEENEDIYASDLPECEHERRSSDRGEEQTALSTHQTQVASHVTYEPNVSLTSSSLDHGAPSAPPSESLSQHLESRSAVPLLTQTHGLSEQQSMENLTKKLQQLKDERLCKVCLDRQADVVFIPCGHICCCLECTQALRQCPVCRVKIDQAVRTYTH